MPTPNNLLHNIVYSDVASSGANISQMSRDSKYHAYNGMKH